MFLFSFIVAIFCSIHRDTPSRSRAMLSCLHDHCFASRDFLLMPADFDEKKNTGLLKIFQCIKSYRLTIEQSITIVEPIKAVVDFGESKHSNSL